MANEYLGYFSEANDGEIVTMADARKYLDRLDPQIDLRGLKFDHGAYAAARVFFDAVGIEVDKRIAESVSPPVLEALRDLELIASDAYETSNSYGPALPRYILECKPIYAR